MEENWDAEQKVKTGGEPHPFDAAIRAVRNKKPAPEIDFTLHTMDDGTQVSTLDRVCKGTFALRLGFIFFVQCLNIGVLSSLSV